MFYDLSPSSGACEKPGCCRDTRPAWLVTGRTGQHQHTAQLHEEAEGGRLPSGEDFFIILHNSTSPQLLLGGFFPSQEGDIISEMGKS